MGFWLGLSPTATFGKHHQQPYQQRWLMMYENNGCSLYFSSDLSATKRSDITLAWDVTPNPADFSPLQASANADS